MKTKRRSVFAAITAFAAAPFARGREEKKPDRWEEIQVSYWKGLVMECRKLLGEEGDWGWDVPEDLEKHRAMHSSP